MGAIPTRKPRRRVINVRSLVNAFDGAERPYPHYTFSARRFLHQPRHFPFGPRETLQATSGVNLTRAGSPGVIEDEVPNAFTRGDSTNDDSDATYWQHDETLGVGTPYLESVSPSFSPGSLISAPIKGLNFKMRFAGIGASGGLDSYKLRGRCATTAAGTVTDVSGHPFGPVLYEHNGPTEKRSLSIPLDLNAAGIAATDWSTLIFTLAWDLDNSGAGKNIRVYEFAVELYV